MQQKEHIYTLMFFILKKFMFMILIANDDSKKNTAKYIHDLIILVFLS